MISLPLTLTEIGNGKNCEKDVMLRDSKDNSPPPSTAISIKVSSHRAGYTTPAIREKQRVCERERQA